MILHCTQKLAAKLSMVSAVPCAQTGSFSQWHAHLYLIDRRQCVMFCHDASRFVLFLSGLKHPQFANLETHFRDLLFTSLRRFGVTASRVNAVALALGPVCYDTATDRSVLSSMKIAHADLGARLAEVPNVIGLDPVAVSFELNQRPATVHKQWIWPFKAMLAAVEAL